jgi:hypothetical protein
VYTFCVGDQSQGLEEPVFFPHHRFGREFSGFDQLVGKSIFKGINHHLCDDDSSAQRDDHR